MGAPDRTAWDEFVDAGPSTEGYLTVRLRRATSAATPRPHASDLARIKRYLSMGVRRGVLNRRQADALFGACVALYGAAWRRA